MPVVDNEPNERDRWIPIQAYVLSESGKIRHLRPKNGTDFSLEELREVVGGNIEIVHLSNNEKGQQLLMVVNEDGIELELQPNEVASRLARQRVLGRVLVCQPFLIK